MTDYCGQCGTPIRIVTSPEGTCYHEPIDAHREELEEAIDLLRRVQSVFGFLGYQDGIVASVDDFLANYSPTEGTHE